MSHAADFSGRPPGAAALLNAGFRVVIRYIGLGSEGKQITKAEWQDYLNQGVFVILVAELGVNDAWEGLDDFALGVARAKIVLADIAATAPASVDQSKVLVACAADAHASGSQITDAVQYAKGFASIIGKARAGFYGFMETVLAVYNAGAVGWLWLAGSEPGKAVQAWLAFWQRNRSDPGNPATVVINGTTVDVNEIYNLPSATGGTAFMGLTDAEQDELLYKVRQVWDSLGASFANNGGQWWGYIVTLLGRYMPAGTSKDPKDALSQAGGLSPVLMGTMAKLDALTAVVTAMAKTVSDLQSRPPVAADPDAIAHALISAGLTGGATVDEVRTVVESTVLGAFTRAGTA